MKVAILSKADKSGGGASRIAQELCILLQAKGYVAHHYLARYSTRPHRYARPLYGRFFLRKIVARLNGLTKRLGFPELIPWELGYLHRKIREYDIVHIHDISSAISPFSVRYLARELPTVWTFHDCSPFTGGCLHPLACTNFRTRCHQCPQLGRWPIDSNFDFTGLMQDIKRKTAEEGRFTAVVPSTWLQETAVESGMFPDAMRPKIIPNGTDINIFKPLDTKKIRKKLGLPQDRRIILLAAAYIQDELKGIRYSLQALARFQRTEFFLLIVGYLDDQTRLVFASFDHLYVGYVADDQLKAEYFAAADFLLFTSLGETFSLITLEAMATGTPSVSFAIGGVTDIVKHNETGYLVPPEDVEALVTGIKSALFTDSVSYWGPAARRRAVNLYSHEVFLNNHLELYRDVIDKFER
jgi:glycosyltransferase involved in cell wall biosynthesis